MISINKIENTLYFDAIFQLSYVVMITET